MTYISRCFRRHVTTFFLGAALLGAASQQAIAQPACDYADATDKAPAYTAIYDLYRNGDLIGSHTISYTQNAQTEIIEANTKMRVKIMGITAYKYEYKAREFWCAGQLEKVLTDANDNGPKVKTTIQRTAQNFNISGTRDGEPIAEASAPLTTLPTSHWTPDVLSAPMRMQTITGDVFPITVEPVEVADRHKGFSGTAYAVDGGGYTYTTYYGANNLWHGMAFDRGMKGFFEFKCTNCDDITPPSRPIRDNAPRAQSAEFVSGVSVDGILRSTLGKPYIGTLTYLDYQSETNVDIPVNMRVDDATDLSITYAIIYPDETDKNADQTLSFSEDMRLFGGRPVITHDISDTGHLHVTTQYDGKDDNRAATIQERFKISASTYVSEKRVSFDGGATWVTRNQYKLSR